MNPVFLAMMIGGVVGLILSNKTERKNEHAEPSENGDYGHADSGSRKQGSGDWKHRRSSVTKTPQKESDEPHEIPADREAIPAIRSGRSGDDFRHEPEPHANEPSQGQNERGRGELDPADQAVDEAIENHLKGSKNAVD